MLHDAGRVSQSPSHFAFRKLPQLQSNLFPAGRCPGRVHQAGWRSERRFAKGQRGIMSLPAIAEPISPQEECLESLLQRRLGNRIRDLRVMIRPEGVILQGRTSTYHAKQLAQHAAMELGNLPILSNAIEVR